MTSSRPGHRVIHRNPIVLDRKSTRLNSSHSQISYAVFRFKNKHRAAGQNAAHCYFSNSLVLLVASIVAGLALALVAALTLYRLSIGVFARYTRVSLLSVYF